LDAVSGDCRNLLIGHNNVDKKMVVIFTSTWLEFNYRLNGADGCAKNRCNQMVVQWLQDCITAALMKGNIENLKTSIPILGGLKNLDAEEFSKLCRWHIFEKDHQVLNMEDQSTDIFFIVKGAVTVRSFASNGKEVSYCEIRAGGLFGEFSAIDGKPRSASIETLDKALIARMRAKDFRRVIAKNPELGLRLAELLVKKIRTLNQRVFEFGTMSVSQRIQAELLRLCEAQFKPGQACIIKPAPTHYQFATRVATHREAVSREMSNLAAKNIIQINRKSIKVLDINRLRNMVESS
jgi:CRP-like cAMP-binding protein